MNKELEALEKLKECLTLVDENRVKALKIIKEKKVNVNYFLMCCNNKAGILIYNSLVSENQELIQEEYNILKEVLL